MSSSITTAAITDGIALLSNEVISALENAGRVEKPFTRNFPDPSALLVI
ncbi:hypothetical protein [Nocardia heshunensis]